MGVEYLCDVFMFLAKSSARILTEMALLFHRAFERDAITLRDVSSLLCVELTRMGDLIAALPAIRILRKHLPKARIVVAVEKKYESLMRMTADVDCVFGFENTARFLGIASTVKTLHGEQFDLVCSMSPSIRNALVAGMIPARARVGYFQSSNSLTPFLETTSVESVGIVPFLSLQYSNENIYKRPLKICEALGLPIEHWVDDLRLKQDHQLALLDGLEINDSESYLVFHPFAGWNFRKWNGVAAVEFMNLISDEGLEVVLVGDESDKDDGMKMISSLRRPNLAKGIFGLPLDALGAIIQCASVFVGTDSGPLHLAAALGVPVVGLYGPAHPRFTAPPTRSGSYIFKQVECSPCEQRDCIRSEHPCMHLILAEEVLKRVRDVRAISAAS